MALWETDSVLETETGENSVFTPPQGMVAKPLRTLKHKGFTLYFFIWDESVYLRKMAGVVAQTKTKSPLFSRIVRTNKMINYSYLVKTVT